jgi:integrase
MQHERFSRDGLLSPGASQRTAVPPSRLGCPTTQCRDYAQPPGFAREPGRQPSQPARPGLARVRAVDQDELRARLARRRRQGAGLSQHVAAYGAWLAGHRDGAKALADPKARDYAARDFKRHLKVDRGWKPASVNLALAAGDHFNRFLGLGPANVKREPLAQAAPRALSIDQQRELVRAAEDSKPRDRAIVTLLLYTALRLNELVSLDVDDVSICARKGLLVIRSGKGDL